MNRFLLIAAMSLCAMEQTQAQNKYGIFEGLPLAMENSQVRSGKPFRLTKRVWFKDANGLEWTVPPGSMTDGATVPWLFELIVGDNYDGPYFPAAVIHDYFCCVQTRLAHDTHRNFYYAMLANDTPDWQAWLMYTAVRFGGPDWDELQPEGQYDGSRCFDDELDLGSRDFRGTSGFDASAQTADTKSSTFLNTFFLAAAKAEDERKSYIVSKLQAVSRTLRSTDGKYLDVTSDGPIAATFEGVEKLKLMVDGVGSFSTFDADGSNPKDFSVFGLVVPAEGGQAALYEKIKNEGGLAKIAEPWSASELALLGIATAELPEKLPGGYLQKLIAENGLEGTGVEWAAADTPQERLDWSIAIQADRSVVEWNDFTRRQVIGDFQ